MKAPIPANETARIETLHKSGILDSLPEQAYDDITLLASHICETPMSVMSIIDEERQWFKSKVGLDDTETPRELSFCAHAILEPESLLIVPDARLDPRFVDNPMVVDGPQVRFYAGAPLVTAEGHALGSLCVIDQTPRQLTEVQLNALQALARQVMAQFTLHQQAQALKSLNEQLESLSVRDELTGVNNRRAFNIALRRELARAERYNSPLSLVLLDVDSFKSYNDSFGHQAGDEVLRQVGKILPGHINDMAVAARYGGEEFALILPDTSAKAALAIAEKVRSVLELSVWPRRAITASFGVATTTDALCSEEELIAAADAALYSSKSAGRNRVTHCLIMGYK
ncbi:sensor domain-containing diguanylate cyclase [bacterium]|nr:MAG: sensor domain-containing diguanylate cyclase [bacterium]